MLSQRMALIGRILIGVGLLLAMLPPAQAQGEAGAQLLGRLNALRVQSGLLPLAVSPQLATAAQRHATDMSVSGNISHIGTDGSTMESRMRAAGFGFWRSFGIVGENIYGGQTASVDVAWEFWTTSPTHRTNLLSTRFREVGVGVATSDRGTYFVLDFGAQPNVLPFFVSGSPPTLSLLLTNEDNITTGDGIVVMGQAIEVRAGEGYDLEQVPWRPWARTIELTLPDGPETRTISVEYRDDLGRGTRVTQTINVSALGTAPETPTPTDTPTATSTPTTESNETSTPTRTATATPRATATATATTTPRPSATAQPAASATTTEAPPTEAATATIPPTATPPPSITPTEQVVTVPTVTATPRVVVAVFPTSVSASRLTPPAPKPVSTERPLIASYAGAPANLLLALLGVQVVVFAIGAAVIAARTRRRT